MKFTLPPAVKLRGGIIASRLGFAALAAILTLLTQHGLPRETRDLLAYGGAAVGAALTALPSAFLAAGIVRPVSPQFASLCQHLGQQFGQMGQMLSRPGVSTADVQAAVAAEMRVITPQIIQFAADEVENRKNRSNMIGFAPSELGAVAVPPPPGPSADQNAAAGDNTASDQNGETP